MRRMIVAAVLAALALPVGASARQPAPAAPLPQAQAAALAGSPISEVVSSTTRTVSPQEALAAASLPGASVTIAPGLSAQQAVGLRSLGASTQSTTGLAAAAAIGCNANDVRATWGTWPYEQKLSDTTYWCAVYGDHITYTSSTANATGTLCGPSWTSSQIISGGIGYSWFVVRSSAGWSCPTVIPWVSLHPSHSLDVARNAWGTTQVVGTS